jgi:superfamily II DNA or RNA helicase
VAKGIRIALGSRITVTGAPPALLDAVRAANRFPNPAYRDAFLLGRRTYGIPKEIFTFEEEEGRLLLPRGFLPGLLSLIAEEKPKATVTEGRVSVPRPYPAAGPVVLRPYQVRAVAAALAAGEGLLTMPTGAGKTVTAIEMLRLRGERALILVHSRELHDQWRRCLMEQLGIAAGSIQGARRTEGETVTVAMLQTLQRLDEDALEALAGGYGLVLLDEAHRAPARTVAEILDSTPCRYRYGLTATPYRRDGLDLLIHRAIGPILIQIGTEEVEAAGGVVPTVVRPIETGFHPQAVDSWADMLQALVEDEGRNRLIMRLAERAATTMAVLVLTDRVEHVGRLAALTSLPHHVLHGQLDAETRRESMAAMVDTATEARITIGSTGLLGEGLDVARWQALILATPISSRTKLLQAIGRVVRPYPGKARAFVADLVDDNPLAVSSFRKRVEIYREHNIPLVATRRFAAEKAAEGEE